MLLLAKMICYAKHFMPSGTVLTCKPLPNSVDECKQWDSSMRVLGAEVEGRVMVFVSKYHTDTHRTRKPFVQGVMKNLQKIPLDQFPVVEVVDRTVTTLSKHTCWYFGHVSEFR